MSKSRELNKYRSICRSRDFDEIHDDSYYAILDEIFFVDSRLHADYLYSYFEFFDTYFFRNSFVSIFSSSIQFGIR